MWPGYFDLDSHVRRGRLGAGEWVFLSNERAFSFETSRKCSCVALHLSGQWLQNYLPIPAQALEEQLVGQRPEQTPWHLSLRYCLQAIADTPIETLGRDGIFALEQVPRLLSLACDLTNVDANRHQSMIMRTIMLSIRMRYSTPGLDAEMVGEEVGVSRRYLYTIMAAHGTSFARELQKLRLEKAAEILVSPRFAGARISDIAFAVGLLDPVHFAKSFKAKFDLTPTQYRERKRLHAIV